MINYPYNRKVDVMKLFGDGGEKKRDRKTHGGRDRDRETDGDRETDRDRETNTQRGRDKEAGRNKLR